MTSPLTFNSASRIIQLAYEDAGLIQESDPPTPDQYVKGLSRLNDLVNLLQTQGIKLWVNQALSVPLIVGQASYTLGPGGSILSVKPARVLEAYYLDGTGVRRPLVPLAWHDWNMLSQRNQQGQLNSYFVDKQQYNIVVWFWQVPDTTAASGTVELLIQAQIANMVSLTDSVSFPQEWFMALRWMLADELCTGQSPTIMQRCSQRAEAFRTALENWDVEDAPVRFVVDPRTNFSSYRFR